MQSILNKPVSYYPNISSTGAGVVVNLLSILNSTRHYLPIQILRLESNGEVQKIMKSALPCYTVAGVFSKRNNSSLVTPSNLACVDLDSAENYDLPGTLHELRKLPYIAYAGLSCRGKRLFLIVPFATGAYQQHYDRLIQSFTALGLPMGDSCHRSISQPRIVSCNDAHTQWFNHTAKPFHLLPPVKKHYLPKTNFALTGTGNFRDCENHINKNHRFETGNRHHYIKALAGYCKWKGLSQHDTLTGCLAYADGNFTAREIQAIVQYFYKP